MTFSPYVKGGIVLLSGLSLFWFPWPVTVALMFFSGLVFPPASLALGIAADLLYYPGTGYLWGTLMGGMLAIVSALVRHFVKTRIM
ncbi:MAG: hypothetical protein JWL75_460 [Parcubacteria group bacterium]|nr:hypothetical protein [Parcubacteria group bacterium]